MATYHEVSHVGVKALGEGACTQGPLVIVSVAIPDNIRCAAMSPSNCQGSQCMILESIGNAEEMSKARSTQVSGNEAV